MVLVVNLNGVRGIAIQPYITEKDRLELVASLPPSSRFACIDLAPSTEMCALIDQLIAAGHRLACFADHHLNQVQVEKENAEGLRQRFGEAIRLVDRIAAPSCAHLITRDEWRKSGVSVVLFHADNDGFLGFLKACGAWYLGLEDDADISERSSNGISRLSRVGRLLVESLNTIPYFSMDPEGHLREKQRVYQTIADWVASGCQASDTIHQLKYEVSAACYVAKLAAYQLADEAIELPGRVVLSDLRPAAHSGIKVSLPTWRYEVLRRHGNVLLCVIGIGHMGEQVYVELPRDWWGKIDLRVHLPDGVSGRLRTRVQVPLDKWEAFLARWREVFSALDFPLNRS
ncbi:MAG: hypothetical protein PHI73_01170 [Patescibacteria group bacterium]|nr:hypothetical protein [Patescibacteria group bacterium]